MKRMKNKIIKGLNWREESFNLCTIYDASAVHLINHKIEEKGANGNKSQNDIGQDGLVLPEKGCLGNKMDRNQNQKGDD